MYDGKKESSDLDDECYRCKYLRNLNSWQSARSRISKLVEDLEEIESSLATLEHLESHLLEQQEKLDIWCDKIILQEQGVSKADRLTNEYAMEIEILQKQFDTEKNIYDMIDKTQKEFDAGSFFFRIDEYAEQYLGRETKKVLSILNLILSEFMERKDSKDFKAILSIVFPNFESNIMKIMQPAVESTSCDDIRKAIANIKTTVSQLTKSHDSSIPLSFLSICEEIIEKAEESSKDNDLDVAAAYQDAARTLVSEIDKLYNDPELNRALKLGR